MKIPLSWLSEFIDLEMTPQQIAKILTQAGIEVEAIHVVAPKLNKVVVGRVTGVEKHPTADKLCVAQVTDGSETYQVVCGAPNCRQGLKTAFAMAGGSLEDPTGSVLKIKKTKLRGVDSFGMLCSSQELGVGGDEDGIIEFDEHLKEGADVGQLYADTVFEVALTPNLGYCASMLGVSRELSAVIRHPIKWSPTILDDKTSHECAEAVKVRVEDQKRCPRYSCRLVKDVKIAPSPDWLQKKLLSAGVRPVNNVVDITNYVLMEVGQPLHAFDFGKLHSNEIIIRCAKEGEKLVTLDSKERKLHSEDLLICDAKEPIALAGVMGGLDSEISDQTTNILIESAHFDRRTIRRTSQRTNLQSDASKHFERGADPNKVLFALDQAAVMIQELAGGSIVPGVVDQSIESFTPKVITCRIDRTNKMIGLKLSLSEIEDIFTRLGMEVKEVTDNELQITVPTYRGDIEGEIDLIEEVARLYGYENIPKASPTFHTSTIPHHPMFRLERSLSKRLVGEGLQEFVSCDLIGPSILEVIDPANSITPSHISVLNPNSVEQSILRTSLLPGFLRILKYNYDRQVADIAGFEIGRIHLKNQEQMLEQTALGIILTGKAAPHFWEGEQQEVDFFQTKGILENIFQQVGLSQVIFKKSANQTLHDGRQAYIWCGEQEIGFIGEIHPAITRRLGIAQRIYFAEVNLTQIIPLISESAQMEPLAIYPSSERDWTMTLDESIPAQQLLEAVKKVPSRLLESVSLINIYRNEEKVGKGKKNITLRFVYRNPKKTIQQEAVDNEHARIIEATQQEVTHAK